MKRRFELAAAVVAWALLLAVQAGAEEVLLKEDFSSGKVNEAWKQTYPEAPAMSIDDGALNVRPGTVWYVPSKKFSPVDLAGGLCLVVDMKLYPMPGYEWKPSGNFYPIGLQDSDGGVGNAYARFCLIDENGDGKSEAVRFQTSNGVTQYSTTIPNYDATQDSTFHQFRIDWRSNVVEAYFDGRRIAGHSISIADPLWIVGRNELGGTLIKGLKVSTLAPRSAAKGQGAELRIKGIAQEYGKLRLVIASLLAAQRRG